MNPLQPLRSLLFVPADDERKLAKAIAGDSDALIVDLEDAVAPPRRTDAREITRTFLRKGQGSYAGAILVRFNQCASPDFERDCRLIPDAVPDGVVLAKCQSAEDVRRLDSVLAAAPKQCAILPMIESAIGLIRAYEIATASARVAALVFGAEDFSSDTGIGRTPGEPELVYARSAVVVSSRAAGIRAIDTPFLAYRDQAALRTAAQSARNLGFSGKLAIHPAQLATLHSVFQPTEEEIADAQRVSEWASLHGTGASAMEGRMIDEAIVRRARLILKAASGQGSSGAAQ